MLCYLFVVLLVVVVDGVNWCYVVFNLCVCFVLLFCLLMFVVDGCSSSSSSSSSSSNRKPSVTSGSSFRTRTGGAPKDLPPEGTRTNCRPLERVSHMYIKICIYIYIYVYTYIYIYTCTCTYTNRYIQKQQSLYI
jgi:hypothetical protein